MFLYVVLFVVAVVAAFVVYAATRRPEYVISREITIDAPAEKVFPYLNSNALAEKWHPWRESDPTLRMEITGPEFGVGSRASWDSPGRMGKGSATVVESVPNERVSIKLEYFRPMTMTQDAEYLLRSSGDRSVVTWSVRGTNKCGGGIMCLLINMDKMVGGSFEKGLSNLKTLVEAK